MFKRFIKKCSCLIVSSAFVLSAVFSFNVDNVYAGEVSADDVSFFEEKNCQGNLLDKGECQGDLLDENDLSINEYLVEESEAVLRTSQIASTPMGDQYEWKKSYGDGTVFALEGLKKNATTHILYIDSDITLSYLVCNTDLIIRGDGKHTLTLDSSTYYPNSSAQEFRALIVSADATTLTIEDGAKIVVDAQFDREYRYTVLSAVLVSNLKMTGGDVKVLANKCGIMLSAPGGSDGNMTMSGGKLYVESSIENANASPNSQHSGIKGYNGKFTMTGGTVSVKTKANAIDYDGDISVSGGSIKASGEVGIMVAKDLTISGGTTESTGTDHGSIAAGITHVHDETPRMGKVTISGKDTTVIAKCKNFKALFTFENKIELKDPIYVETPANGKVCAGTIIDDPASTPIEFIGDKDGKNFESVVLKSKKETPKPSDPSKPSSNEKQKETQVSDFVERMYSKALKRSSDAGGKKDWTGRLLGGKSCGAGLAQGFICSPEFTNQDLGNDEFLNRLYLTFFDRQPDEGGKAYWMERLNGGTSRNEVLAGFVNSLEFANLCDKFGIARGTMEYDGSFVYNEGVRNFVLRNYSEILGRAGETMGIEDWCYKINKGQMSMRDVAVAFLNSQEFLNKNLNNEEYVKVLYRAFLGREADAPGLADWKGKLDSGAKSRDEIVNGFADSQEFADIMAKYQ